MRKIFYALSSMGVLGIFAAVNFFGVGMSGAKKGHIPKDVRQSPGGYRAYGFWAGGK